MLGRQRGSSINEQLQTRYRCLPLATSTCTHCAPGATVLFRKTDEGYDAVCLCVGCRLKTLENACAQLEEMFDWMYPRNITSVYSKQCSLSNCVSSSIGEKDSSFEHQCYATFAFNKQTRATPRIERVCYVPHPSLTGTEHDRYSEVVFDLTKPSI